uniref:Uncharacterized protein n=1 Tax=Nicotiana tabacum TaxID=4097 RepID=A0A1S4DDN8_TOBAC|nr:PREDICTED: uncharacterized protein LOC107828674 [Nicotiana tabacum]
MVQTNRNLISIVQQPEIVVQPALQEEVNDIPAPQGYKFVITEECPEKPDEDATDDQVKACDKWVKADEMARCYILTSMANVLQHQHQFMGSAYDMLKGLKEMFGSSVRDHILKMMDLLNELEVLGAVIDKESQVEMVLQTLHDSFQ